MCACVLVRARACVKIMLVVTLCCPLQVSHHPPAAAHHVISQRGWTLWQDITIDSKFRGKYISVMPRGFFFLMDKSFILVYFFGDI